MPLDVLIICMYYREVQGPDLPYCCQLTAYTEGPDNLMLPVGTCITYKSSVALEPIAYWKYTCSEEAAFEDDTEN